MTSISTSSPRRRPRRGVRALILVLAAAGLALLPPSAATSAPARAASPAAPAGVAARPAVLKHRLTIDGERVRLRLQRVRVRTAAYRVRVQQADGSFVDQRVAPSRAYLGHVVGDPTAMAAAVVGHDGVVRGSVTLDRGRYWLFDGREVVRSPEDDPVEFRWPDAADASLNVSVAPGQVGSTTRRFDLGVDLDSGLFAGTLGSDVDAAVDLVDRLAVQMMIPFEGAARLRPAVGRVVLRGAAGSDPYAGLRDGEKLDLAESEWNRTQADASRDDVLVLHATGEYGGLAYTNVAGTSQGRALAGYFNGITDAYPITRHEIGHTWGPGDISTGAPEGRTIMSGNALDRFDGTELSAILRHRDRQQSATAPFSAVADSKVAFPPYAALDLRDGATSGDPLGILPLANDGDANGGPLRLVRVDRRSHLGGTVARDGAEVTYTAPAVSAADTVDWFSYRAADDTGRTATGVVVLRVDPGGPADVDTWAPYYAETGAELELVNLASSLLAAPRRGAPRKPDMVQRTGRDAGTRFTAAPSGAQTTRLTNVASGRCLSAEGARVVQRRCAGSGDAATTQRWDLRSNPEGGVSLVGARGRCLTTSSVAAGASLVTGPCGRALATRWTLGRASVDRWRESGLPAGDYRFVNVASGHDLSTTTAGAQLEQASFSDPASRWHVAAGPVRTLIGAAFGQCIDVYGNAMESGAPVGSYDCYRGYPNQSWRILENPAGGYALRAVSSGLCLAPDVSSGFPSLQIAQRLCTSDATTRWWAVPLGGADDGARRREVDRRPQ